MTPSNEEQLSPRTLSGKADAPQNAHLNIFYPRHVWSRSGIQRKYPEDQTVFRKWRLGFFVFYGAVALLLGGLAVIAERPGTITTVAARLNPPTAATDPGRHQN
jgi:hypothetical protein